MSNENGVMYQFMDQTVAPEFTVTTTVGSKFSLSEQRGKVVVLFFTSVGCTVCTRQLPAMGQLYQEYRDKPIEMLAINVFPQYPKDEFLAYMAKNQGGDHLYVAEEGPSVAGLYQITSTGITVIVNKEGGMNRRYLPPGFNYSALKFAVDELLSQ